METWKDKLPWESAGPLIFLAVAAGACFLLPPEARKEAVYLVIGAAITRVKIAK
ncbi:MAG TPA: hypothetical protein VMV86_01960 [Methanosarcinales archaeon]|nr:hypothetical protein [Methanosarcinales archaeon]